MFSEIIQLTARGHVMNQYMKFLKFLFAFLLIPNLYGMHFGEVCRTEKECPQFVEVVKQAMGVNVKLQKGAERWSKDGFDVFKERNVEGSNIIFWDGDVYVNGLFRVTRGFDDIRINGKKYHTIQLCEILGCPVNEMKAMQDIPNVFSRIESALRYFPIRSFWNESKSQKEYDEIDKILREHSAEHPSYQDCLKCEADYVMGLRVLEIDTITPTPDTGSVAQTSDVDTTDLIPEKNEFRESYRKANDVIRPKMNELLKKFGDYIISFDKDDGERFLEGLQQSEEKSDLQSYICEVDKLCLTYNRYTHTEYIVRYLQKKSEVSTKPLYALSFYDACGNCERMLAKTTPIEEGKLNTIIVSGSEYKASHEDKSSRKKDRNPAQVNKSFLQIQLDPK